VVIICGGFAYDYLMTNITFIPSSNEERAAIQAEVAAQDETAFYKPPQSPLTVQSSKPR